MPLPTMYKDALECKVEACREKEEVESLSKPLTKEVIA